MLIQLKDWFLDSNIRNFVIGIVSLGLLYYIYRGQDHHEKTHRLFKSVLSVIFLIVLYAMFYGFLK